jgi:hypothetical protein
MNQRFFMHAALFCCPFLLVQGRISQVVSTAAKAGNSQTRPAYPER